jgi:Fe-S-cluster containining protein
MVKFNKPCVFAIKGQGCAIHESKPSSCKSFKCAWLHGLFEDDMRPDKSNIIGILENESSVNMIDYIKLVETSEDNDALEVAEWCEDRDIGTTIEPYQSHSIPMNIFDS